MQVQCRKLCPVAAIASGWGKSALDLYRATPDRRPPVPGSQCICAGMTRITVPQNHDPQRGGNIMLGTILIVTLLLVLLGAIPSWPHSRSLGYMPSGAIGILLVVVIVLVLVGRI